MKTPLVWLAERKAKQACIQLFKESAERSPLRKWCLATSAKVWESVQETPELAALPLEERLKLAEVLEATVVESIDQIVSLERIFGRMKCPSGHPLGDALFTKQLLGYSCEECQQVFEEKVCTVSR